jgi:N-acyl-D-amino-acid deacylase
MSRADCWIRGATVYDGLQTEPRHVSVGITNSRIAHVGDEPAAVDALEVIDGGGLFLCPGFIDTHASTGLGYMLPHAADNKLFQGVTTEMVGNCGTSAAPIGPLLASVMDRLAEEIGIDFTWSELGDWIEQVEAYGLQYNSGSFVGHSTLRAGHCSNARAVSEAELRTMIRELAQAMEDGALGLSSGLVYAPGSFADTEELVTLAAEAGRHGGSYVSHIRNERDEVETAVDEAIEIGRRGKLPVLISHLKVAERPNWGRMRALIERIEKARRQGQAVAFDVYPYTAVSTKLRTFLPTEIMDSGLPGLVERLENPEWIARCHCWLLGRETDFAGMLLIGESLPGAAKCSIADLAGERGVVQERMLTDLLRADPEAWIVYHCLDEADVDTAVLWPDSMICSDSWSHPVNAPNQFGDPHPRTYGAFTRFLERYALTGRIPFGKAVRKLTSLPAAWLGLSDRGRIEEGAAADLVLLDPARLKEKATFEKPRQMSEGCVRVWVNGVTVLADGEILGARPGRFLRRASAAIRS